MPRSGAATRRQIIDAAEALFAERGIDGVSLREINASAGQRNATALQYHFGDRQGLLLAVLGKHHAEVEARRHSLLDGWEAVFGGLPGGGGDDGLRSLSAALVRPSAAKLADPDGGRSYLRILAQLLNRREPVLDPGALNDPSDSTRRWRHLVGPLLSAPVVRRLHRRFMAIRMASVELGRRAEGPPGDDRLFTSHLIDVVTAILAAVPSDETDRLLAARPPADRSDRVGAGALGGVADPRAG